MVATAIFVRKRDKTIREFSELANPKPQTLNPKPSGLCLLVGSDGSRLLWTRFG
jgi:hypothetical protein